MNRYSRVGFNPKKSYIENKYYSPIDIGRYKKTGMYVKKRIPLNLILR